VVVRRLVGHGCFDGVETARVMTRLYARARLLVNCFQPSFNLKEKRRGVVKFIKRYHSPATPFERALGHPKLPSAIKRRPRETYRTLDRVQLLATIRAAQEEPGERGLATVSTISPADPLSFARSLGTAAMTAEARATHRQPAIQKRIRMSSKVDSHLDHRELARRRAAAHCTGHRAQARHHQSSDVQRQAAWFRRRKVAQTAIVSMPLDEIRRGAVDDAACDEHSAPPTAPPPSWPRLEVGEGQLIDLHPG
jgi:hypothetical protein